LKGRVAPDLQGGPRRDENQFSAKEECSRFGAGP